MIKAMIPAGRRSTELLISIITIIVIFEKNIMVLRTLNEVL